MSPAARVPELSRRGQVSPDVGRYLRRMGNRQKIQLFYEFERWGFDSKGWEPTTRGKYLRRVKACDAWLMQNRNSSILWAKLRDLEAYVASTTKTARNRNDVRQALVGFGDFLVWKGYAEENHAISLPRLKEPTYLPHPLTIEEARRVALVAPSFGKQDAALIMVLLYGGLRKTEARTLKWENTDASCEWLTIRGKGSKERAIPLGDEAASALLLWRIEADNAEWMFPSPRRHNAPVSDTYVKKIIYQVGDIAQIEGLHPHKLRHTVATRMIETGSELRDVQVFLGHSDPKTTAIYTKVRPARLRDAVNRLDFNN